MGLDEEKRLPELGLNDLKESARKFVATLSGKPLTELFGVTDGKAVGTYVEAGLHAFVASDFSYVTGNAASGIDFPELEVDLKVTSWRQPQSSSPFRDASQKVFGLGYNLLLLVYEKNDDRESQTTSLTFRNVVFIPAVRTGDYQLTRGLLQILAHDANVDDVDALIEERNLPLDEIGRRRLAEQIVAHPPEQGYITVSNALQWRLQYGHAIRLVGTEDGEGLENLLEG